MTSNTAIIVIGIIAFSRVCDSFADAICFGNNQRWMKELWHIAKAFRDFVPYGALIYFAGMPSWWYIAVIPMLWVLHEMPYKFFRWLSVWQWDRKVKIKVLCWLWGIPYNRGR
jgi:hypothetical protein